ncbi:MAG: GDSL-type esterase/lipase family protein [Gammaproteobacteria bacterium]|nr:GDSL-type esterase/lipase family protein [Gammaproteobacteria bacterium]
MKYGCIRVVFVAILLSLTNTTFAGVCNTIIMPLGDSITKGTGSTSGSGYRRPLSTHLSNNGFNFDLVGSLQNGPDTFDFDHEGHGGWHTDDPVQNSIAPYTYEWLRKNPADYVLLHIGTNDISSNSEDAAEVAKVLDEIDKFSPETTVFLARIIDRDTQPIETTIFNDAVEAMALDRINLLNDKIVVVDQQSALIYPTDLADAVHPNNTGYQKMADTWYASLAPHLTTRCSGVPKITSTPEPMGYTSRKYQYDVRAFGEAPLFYELTSAPVDMTIDVDTGLLSWNPTTAGIADVQLRVYNAQGDTFINFSIDVQDTFVLDNGDLGTTAKGTWSISGGINPFGFDSLFSNAAGNTYTFDTGVIGTQEVSLWWTAYTNRVTNVPVEIYDGTVLLDTVTVNQTANGGAWNALGTYTFNTGARIVIHSLGGGTTSADAVRLIVQ